MTEGEPREPAYILTHDTLMQLSDVPWAPGSYRIRIFEKIGDIPIVLVADAPQGYRVGVAPVTQFLAADILKAHFSRRLWEKQPMRWIEEETIVRKKKGKVVEQPKYWDVTFRLFLPRQRKLFDEKRLQIDEASRRPLKAEDLQGQLGLRLL